jgi:cytochrome c oxidase subunit 1
MSLSPEAHAAVHHGPSNWITRYVFSKDHKVIGIQYWSLALAAVAVGMFLSVLMRLQLAFPDADFSVLEKLFPVGMAGGVLAP